MAATAGVWYTVAQDFDVNSGIFHSQIWDTATGNQLLDQFNTISGWDLTDAAFFDSFAFFAGDLTPEDTIGNIGNIGVIDNVNIVAVTTPEPGTLALIAGGLIPLVGGLKRRRAR